MTVPVPDEWWRDGPPRTREQLIALHLNRLPAARGTRILEIVTAAYTRAFGVTGWDRFTAALLAELAPEPVPSQESAIPYPLDLAALAGRYSVDPARIDRGVARNDIRALITECAALRGVPAPSFAEDLSRANEPRRCGDPDCDCDVPFAGSRSGAFTEITSFADIEGGRWVYMVDLPGFEGVRATVTRDPGGRFDGRWEATTRDPDALARAVESMGSTLGLETVRTQSGREHVFFVRAVTVKNWLEPGAPIGPSNAAEVSGWFTPISTLLLYEPKDTTPYRSERPSPLGG